MNEQKQIKYIYLKMLIVRKAKNMLISPSFGNSAQKLALKNSFFLSEVTQKSLLSTLVGHTATIDVKLSHIVELLERHLPDHSTDDGRSEKSDVSSVKGDENEDENEKEEEKKNAK